MTDSPMTVVVEYQIRPENNSMEEWLSVWNLRGEDARDGEPETLSYATAVNLDNEHNVLVFERYAGGAGSLQKHMERPAHTDLLTTMGERNMTRRRVMSSRFIDVSNYGWWRREDPADGAADGDGTIVVLLGMRFASEAMRDRFIELSQEHPRYCWEREPDTLIYSGGIAAAKADRELDVSPGDLIFVMACTSMAAVEKHRDDPKHLALGDLLAEQGVQPERTFTRTYRTTGNGFLWR